MNTKAKRTSWINRSGRKNYLQQQAFTALKFLFATQYQYDPLSIWVQYTSLHRNNSLLKVFLKLGRGDGNGFGTSWDKASAFSIKYWGGTRRAVGKEEGQGTPGEEVLRLQWGLRNESWVQLRNAAQDREKWRREVVGPCLTRGQGHEWVRVSEWERESERESERERVSEWVSKISVALTKKMLREEMLMTLNWNEIFVNF